MSPHSSPEAWCSVGWTDGAHRWGCWSLVSRRLDARITKGEKGIKKRPVPKQRLEGPLWQSINIFLPIIPSTQLLEIFLSIWSPAHQSFLYQVQKQGHDDIQAVREHSNACSGGWKWRFGKHLQGIRDNSCLLESLGNRGRKGMEMRSLNTPLGTAVTPPPCRNTERTAGKVLPNPKYNS